MRPRRRRPDPARHRPARARTPLVDGGYAARRAACERAARELGVALLREVEDVDAALAALSDDETRRRARHVLTENQRVLDCVDLARRGDLAAIGPL